LATSTNTHQAQTFLVTGGCGFIGSHLVDNLLAQGKRVIVLDDLSTGKRENLNTEASLIVGDIRDAAVVAELVAKVDGVFHLAAVASVEKSLIDWSGTHEINVGGSIHLLQAISQLPQPIPMVFASSSAVYGDNPNLPLVETSAIQAFSPYGVDKYAVELHGWAANRNFNIPFVGLRFFNVYGARQDPHSPYSGVISIFIEKLRCQQPISIFGDGQQTRDFVYVGDVVAALWQSMQMCLTTANCYQVINVCRGQATTIEMLAHTLAEVLKQSPQITYTAARAGDIQQSIGDPGKLNAVLNFRCQTDLPQGLAQIIQG
jgi:UDP-glucose 4-epimerase